MEKGRGVNNCVDIFKNIIIVIVRGGIYMVNSQKTRPRERAIVFIDGNNLYNGLRDCYAIERIDIESFSHLIIQDRELEGIYYADANYIQSVNPNSYSRQQEYFTYIRNIKGLIFRRGYYNKHTKPPTEKLADVFLATDMVDLCHRDKFDHAYLVAGDSDYNPAIDIVVRQGKKVMNVYFDTPRRNSYGLRGHCQGFKNITQQIAEQHKWEPKVKPGPFRGPGDLTSR
jgi:uncharacterized LabA/DUF88 family protein